MGRAASKVEAVEQEVHRLEAIAVELGKLGSSYHLGPPLNGNVPEPPCSGAEPLPRSSSWRRFPCGRGRTPGATGEAQTANVLQADPDSEMAEKLLAGVETEVVAKNLEAHRLTMGGRPSFDPLPHLDPEAKAHYQNPFDWMIEPDAVEEPLPRPKVRATRAEKHQVLQLLDSTDRLRFVPASSVDPRFANGLFAIIKDQVKDRMILDARCPNLQESSTGRWLRTMATAASLLNLTLAPDEDLYMGGEDLRDFYYYFQVPAARARRNFLAGSLPVSAARAYTGFELAEPGHDRYYPALNTLAMGDKNAVSYGQTAHLSLMMTYSDVSLSELISLDSRPPRGSFAAGICIDDLVVLEKRRRGSQATTSTSSRTRSSKVLEAMRAGYSAVGLERSAAKAFEDQTKASFWGAAVDGITGDVRALPSRAIPVMGYILEIVRVGMGTRALLDVVAGSLVSIFRSAGACSAC